MHLLLLTQKESLLAKLKKKIEEEQVDWWNEMSNEEQKEIETGLAEADKEIYKANSTVMNRFNKWH